MVRVRSGYHKWNDHHLPNFMKRLILVGNEKPTWRFILIHHAPPYTVVPNHQHLSENHGHPLSQNHQFLTMSPWYRTGAAKPVRLYYHYWYSHAAD